MQNIFYILVCFIPFLLCIEFLFLYTYDVNINYLLVKGIGNIICIGILLWYDIIFSLYIELIIPIITILLHVSLLIYLYYKEFKNNQSINRIDFTQKEIYFSLENNVENLNDLDDFDDFDDDIDEL